MRLSGAWPLLDQARLRALFDLGLTQASDPGMERYAQRVRDLIGVPVSLVSLVQADQQVFPGMCGLPDPWASRRSTPLSHSFCQHVVASGEPLVIEDARLDGLVRDNLATTEIGVVGYAGMPLTDDDGNVLGSLCAIDTEPRRWTDEELGILRDTALDCSHEIRLRLSRLDADRERERRDAIDGRLQLAAARATRLLGIAEALNTCRTVADLRRVLAGFVDESTGLFDATLHLTTDGLLPRLPTRAVPGSSGIVVVRDLSADDEGLPRASVEDLLGRGARAVGYLPVHSADTDLGVIELLWRGPRVLDSDEQDMASALSAYSSQALERALLLEDRISVAHQMQAAMLTELPGGTGLDLAASYVPARAEERVGGDWYDALVLPSASETGRSPVLVTVGDVTGHDISAATIMGQLRAMLRQTASDHPDEQPSELLARLERSCVAFDLPATGTAVLARLTPRVDGRGWQLTWTNAGHPPPVVVEPDGSARLLPEHDMMFGYSEMQIEPREDHVIDLLPGSAVVLYTDGITDASSVDPLRQTDRLVEVVRAHRPRGAQAMVDALREAFVGMSDDVVTVVVAVP